MQSLDPGRQVVMVEGTITAASVVPEPSLSALLLAGATAVLPILGRSR
jgi:hypothetical protein